MVGNGLDLIVGCAGGDGNLAGVQAHVAFLDADRRQGFDGRQVLRQANTGQNHGQFRRRLDAHEFHGDFGGGVDFGGALETAGGIARALPQLGPVFWLAAGDVFAPDFVFDSAAVAAFEASDHLAHLWLVPNPAHNPRGDFGLSADGRALNLPADDPAPRYTYSTIALLRAELFALPWCDIPPGNPGGIKAPLAPLLRRAMDNGRVSAQLYTGRWTDVGTPERLAELNTLSLDAP